VLLLIACAILSVQEQPAQHTPPTTHPHKHTHRRTHACTHLQSAQQPAAAHGLCDGHMVRRGAIAGQAGVPSGLILHRPGKLRVGVRVRVGVGVGVRVRVRGWGSQVSHLASSYTVQVSAASERVHLAKVPCTCTHLGWPDQTQQRVLHPIVGLHAADSSAASTALACTLVLSGRVPSPTPLCASPPDQNGTWRCMHSPPPCAACAQVRSCILNMLVAACGRKQSDLPSTKILAGEQGRRLVPAPPGCSRAACVAGCRMGGACAGPQQLMTHGSLLNLTGRPLQG